MNTSSFITGIILLLLFIIPVIFLSRKNTNKNKMLLTYFKDLSIQQGLDISQSEVWDNHYAIGIDAEADKLFYLKKTTDNDEKITLRFNDIQKCSVNNSVRTIKEGKNTTNITDCIELKFKSIHTNGSEKTIEFYHAHGNENTILSNQLQLAEKWAKIINQKTNAVT